MLITHLYTYGVIFLMQNPSCTPLHIGHIFVHFGVYLSPHVGHHLSGTNSDKNTTYHLPGVGAWGVEKQLRECRLLQVDMQSSPQYTTHTGRTQTSVCGGVFILLETHESFHVLP